MHVTTTDLSALQAEVHVRDLRAGARRDALARLARCCSPSALRRAGRAVAAWYRHGQLGPGYAVCC